LAEPHEICTPMQQIEIRSLNFTDFVVPVGWYGLVKAAGIGIINTAIVDRKSGLLALEKLGAPDLSSRSQAFEGRRLVRVDGGFVVLNFFKYRDQDFTAAERAKRYRARNKKTPSRRDGVTLRRDATVRHASVTEAEAEAEANKDKNTNSPSPPPHLPTPSLGLIPNARAHEEGISPDNSHTKPKRTIPREALAKSGREQRENLHTQGKPK